MLDQNKKKMLKVVMFTALGFAVLPWLVTIIFFLLPHNTEVPQATEVPSFNDILLLVINSIYFCTSGWWLVPIGLIIFALVKAPPLKDSSLKNILIVQLIFTLIAGYSWLMLISFFNTIH